MQQNSNECINENGKIVINHQCTSCPGIFFYFKCLPFRTCSGQVFLQFSTQFIRHFFLLQMSAVTHFSGLFICSFSCTSSGTFFANVCQSVFLGHFPCSFSCTSPCTFLQMSAVPHFSGHFLCWSGVQWAYAGLRNMRDAGMLHPRHFFSQALSLQRCKVTGELTAEEVPGKVWK